MSFLCPIVTNPLVTIFVSFLGNDLGLPRDIHISFSFHKLKHSKEHVADQTHGSAEITDQSVPSAQQLQSSKSLDLEVLADKSSTLQMCASHMTLYTRPSTSETTPSKANAVIKPLNSVCDLTDSHSTEASTSRSNLFSY